MTEKWSPEWKQQELDKLREEWSDCERCDLCRVRTNVVFGEGNPDADLLFVGEAPGDDEDENGVPMVGPSGQLFDAILMLADVERDDVFVTNILGCQPPKNRDPTKDEKNACIERIHKIVYIVDPIIVVPIGKIALKALARGRDWAITEWHGRVFSSPSPEYRLSGDPNCVEIPGKIFPRTGDNKKKYLLEYDMIPLVHPSFIWRADSYDEKTQQFQKDGWADKTVDDMRYIVDFLAQLKERYSNQSYRGR